MSRSTSGNDTPSSKDFQRLLGANCRRKLEKETFLYDFLHQPFRYAFARETTERTPTATHLLKIVAPALHADLETSHRIIDRGEPLVAGIELVLRHIQAHHDWNIDLARPFILQALIPLYLIAGPNRDQNALCHSLCLLQEAVALCALDQALDHDLTLWVRKRPSGYDPTFRELHQTFSIDLPELTREIWGVPIRRNGKEFQGVQLDRSRLTEARRISLWQVARQWLADAKQITLPAELAVERIAWQAVRQHFQKLLELLGQSNSHLPPFEFTIAAPFDLLDHCERAVEQALVETDSSAQPVDFGIIGGGSAPSMSIAANSVVASASGRSQSRTPLEDVIPSQRAESTNASVALAELSPIDSLRVVEIRSSTDPKLVSSLDQQLGHCRAEQGAMALIVVRSLSPELGARPEGLLQVWQGAFVDYLRDNTEDADLRGFVTPEGEIAVVVEDLDRQTATAIVRDGLQAAANAQRASGGIGDDSHLPLIAGISVVSAPARSFRIQQLMESASRCLVGAANQGAGSVKSIEVY